MKNKAKAMVLELIQREREYLEKQEVGTQEYNDSLKRIGDLEDKLADLEDKEYKNIVEVLKFVFGTVVVPVGMSLLVLKFEETGSVTTALRNWITGIVPRAK